MIWQVEEIATLHYEKSNYPEQICSPRTPSAGAWADLSVE